MSHRRKDVIEGKKTALQDDTSRCYICGARASEIHHVMNGANRKKAEQYGFLVGLCQRCHYRLHHQEGSTIKQLKAIAQGIYEQTHTREEWIREFGRSYL